MYLIGVGLGEIGDDGQRVQISCYKMCKFLGSKVQHTDLVNNTLLHISKLLGK